MRKIISKSLIVLNIILITMLIVLSGILVFFASSKQTIFNHTALLYTSKATTTVAPKTSLVLIKKENKLLKKDDKIIYNITRDGSVNIQCVDVVLSITDGIIILKDNVTRIDISTPSYVGKVVFQNHFLGEIFNAISKNKNTTLIYIIIFGGVIIAGLSITLVFSIINKKNIKMATNNTIEVIVEDDDECDELIDDNAIIEEQVIYDNHSIIEPQQVNDEQTMSEFSEMTEIKQSESSYKIDGTSFSYKIYDELVFVEETPPIIATETTSVTETTSSIDCLLDDIIKQAQEDFYKQQLYDEVTISEIKENEDCTL